VIKLYVTTRRLMRCTMTMRLVVAAAFAALLAGSPRPAIDAALESTAQSYVAEVVSISKLTGRDTAMDFYQRLLEDQDLVESPPPSDYTDAMWQHSVSTIARLDLSAAEQLMTRSFRPMESVRGLEETFIKSSKDGTMQPVAVYVPVSYVPGKPAPLVVFLHGRPQSESQLLAPQFVGDLAERTGTIIVAPYGRAYYDFVGSESDVYDAYDAALKAFTIDPRKRFLVGYSMGGFSVFGVAPLHPEDWSAVMCIAGSLLGSRAHRVVAELPRTRFYVLTGSADDSIPTQYPTTTAVYLRDQGLPVTFYSQPGGKHRLVTLLPILANAWDDMHQGVTRTPYQLSTGFGLPAAPPSMTLKP
jgi:dienelactone hydrolase